MTTKNQLATLCLTAICSLSIPTAQAGNLEPAGINLGGTSFFDGFSSTTPGWTYIGYFQHAQINQIVGNNGNESPAFANPQISVDSIVNQLAYTTSQTFFDGKAHLQFTGLLPLLHFNTSFDAASPVKLSSADGVGDLTLGASLQFDPVISGGRPVYSQRFELDVIAPSGQYSQTTNLNPGANSWAMIPYWAATVLPTPRTEISWRLNYLNNFANNSPDGLPPTVSTTKAGQAAWVNFTASYAVTPTLNLGINGYYFKQLTNDTYDYANGTSDNGMEFGDTGKAQVVAIGPGLSWKASPGNIFNVNAYVQTSARNTTRGKVLNVMWIHPI